MKRPDKGSAAEVANQPFPDADWVKRFPIVSSFLADVMYDDGTLRKQSVVTIREQDGLILASLTDHDLERGLYRTGKTALAAVEALERAIEKGVADWRPWKQQGRKGGK